MKLNVGDELWVKADGLTLQVKVEDASKSDVIMAKLIAFPKDRQPDPSGRYQLDKIYQFKRADIVE